jgi:hypothetical protein
MLYKILRNSLLGRKERRAITRQTRFQRGRDESIQRAGIIPGQVGYQYG